MCEDEKSKNRLDKAMDIENQEESNLEESNLEESNLEESNLEDKNLEELIDYVAEKQYPFEMKFYSNPNSIWFVTCGWKTCYGDGELLVDKVRSSISLWEKKIPKWERAVEKGRIKREKYQERKKLEWREKELLKTESLKTETLKTETTNSLQEISELQQNSQ